MKQSISSSSFKTKFSLFLVCGWPISVMDAIKISDYTYFFSFGLNFTCHSTVAHYCLHELEQACTCPTDGLHFFRAHIDIFEKGCQT